MLVTSSPFLSFKETLKEMGRIEVGFLIDCFLEFKNIRYLPVQVSQKKKD
jgi:hypothetical protein